MKISNVTGLSLFVEFVLRYNQMCDLELEQRIRIISSNIIKN